MTHDELRIHIAASVTASRPAELRGLTSRIVSACWPGGHQDRSNPCVGGRCAVCN
jgi:hypothetical protein